MLKFSNKIIRQVHINKEFMRKAFRGTVNQTHDLLTCKPGTVAGACEPSRWAVTLMDVLTLGSLVVGCYL